MLERFKSINYVELFLIIHFSDINFEIVQIIIIEKFLESHNKILGLRTS